MRQNLRGPSSLLAMLQAAHVAQASDPTMPSNQVRVAEFKKRAQAARPQIEAWQKAGIPKMQMARNLKISGDTLYKYLKEYK
jgi:hypothetical protein